MDLLDYGLFQVQFAGPDNRVDVVTDVTVVLEKFRNLVATPAKSRADVEPALPDGQINISDVTFVLNAFGGADYPFTPTVSPCPVR